MSNHLVQTAARFLGKGIDELTALERHVANHFAQREIVSENTNKTFHEQSTLGQRLADRIAAIGGSWPFIITFLLSLGAWIVLNSMILARTGKTFDPYPYILLNLVLSMLASIQAPVIMMSQNRQAAKDRLDAFHDYEVNLKAELEIAALHQKVDLLREEQWAELVKMQQEQIRLLETLLQSRQAAEKEAQ
jgi:uncharacterized membrane protein